MRRLAIPLTDDPRPELNHQRHRVPTFALGRWAKRFTWSAPAEAPESWYRSEPIFGTVPDTDN